MINLEKFNFNPEDVILFRYPWEEIDILTLNGIFNEAKEYFKDNIMVAIPNNISLESLRQEDYDNLISYLRNGKWTDKSYAYFGHCGVTCSNCGHRISVKGADNGFGHDYVLPKYCENCGSRNS